MIKNAIKLIAKKLLPQVVIYKLRAAYIRTVTLRRTRSIFERAGETPPYLEINILETLQAKYPFLEEYRYDTKSVEERGKNRAEEILRLPEAVKASSFLELGCHDGMVSCFLHRTGKNTTAIDIRSEGFDGRAFREGVRLLQMDAVELQFEDESFDFVFSYDSFEHFSSPELVLREAIRVVKKGGHIYLKYGPVYMSPYGEHAFCSITVPYCNFLFDKKTINDFAKQNRLELIDFTHVNGWSVEDYRKLWTKNSHAIKRLRYKEAYDLAHLDLIRKYPSCFKSKTNCFENLIVESIMVVFEKIAN